MIYLTMNCAIYVAVRIMGPAGGYVGQGDEWLTMTTKSGSGEGRSLKTETMQRKGC